MPVQKFKTLEEAERALWNFRPDAAYYKMLHSLFELAFKYSNIHCEKGVHKFKTIHEANIHRMNTMQIE